jgi:hypothetical protein
VKQIRVTLSIVAAALLLIALAAFARQIEPLPTAVPLLAAGTPAAAVTALAYPGPTTQGAPSATDAPQGLPADPIPTAVPTASIPGTIDPRGEESIVIEQPGNGSRVASPFRLAGYAGPTFEQHLAVRVVLDDGTELAVAGTTIHAEAGQRGPYQAEIPFEVSAERQAFIQVYDASARDGGILHLSSVAVTLLPQGRSKILLAEPALERIAILQPAAGGKVGGGVAHVEGYGLAGFEQTLLVQVLDADGTVIGESPVTVAASDLGQPGPFSADVDYSAASGGPGRIVVRDISPAHGGDAHLASVEIALAP